MKWPRLFSAARIESPSKPAMSSPTLMGGGGSIGGVGAQGGGGFVPEIGSATAGACLVCAGQWGPRAADQRHRGTISGVFNLPFGVAVSPTFTVTSALPYEQYRSPANPNGDGALRC